MNAHVHTARDQAADVARNCIRVSQIAPEGGDASRAMACLAAAARSAVQAATLAAAVGADDAAAAAASAARSIAAASWDVMNAASMSAGILPPGRMA